MGEDIWSWNVGRREKGRDRMLLGEGEKVNGREEGRWRDGKGWERKGKEEKGKGLDGMDWV